MTALTVPARLDRLEDVLAFLEAALAQHPGSAQARREIALAAEELFVNIARYAYAPGAGTATVECAVGGDPPAATIRFSDAGVPYNPLEHADPDLSLSAAERPVGGLGILLVKRIMDRVDYERRGGMNVLTIRKTL